VQKYFPCTISNKSKHALASTEELRAPKILPFSFRLGNTPSIRTSKQGSVIFIHQKRKKKKRKPYFSKGV
jgi:hypothetical protein